MADSNLRIFIDVDVDFDLHALLYFSISISFMARLTATVVLHCGWVEWVLPMLFVREPVIGQ